MADFNITFKVTVVKNSVQYRMQPMMWYMLGKCIITRSYVNSH